MSGWKQGTFAADGSYTIPEACDKFTILMDGTFGGGTVTLSLSHDGGTTWYEDSTYTDGDCITSVEYVGGVNVKIELAGATSPSLNYSIKWA